MHDIKEVRVYRWHGMLELCHAYLMEVDLVQIPAKHEMFFIVFHVGIHVKCSSTILSMGP